ncbi:MAG: DNA translocase FtsK 4TM domain-containing protein [Bacteroidota bacterium]
MAKENSIRARSGSRKKKKSGSAKMNPQLAKFLEFVRSPEGRKVFALCLILVSAFMVIAFASHFFTGYKDQSMLAAGGEAPANWLGTIGAWVSQLFVSRGFGLMGILIPLYMALWGFALLEHKYYKTLWGLLKYVVFGVIWGAVFMAFISHIVWGEPSLLGGISPP